MLDSTRGMNIIKSLNDYDNKNSFYLFSVVPEDSTECSGWNLQKYRSWFNEKCMFLVTGGVEEEVRNVVL